MNSIAGQRESASIAAGKCKRKQKAGGRSGERKMKRKKRMARKTQSTAEKCARRYNEGRKTRPAERRCSKKETEKRQRRAAGRRCGEGERRQNAAPGMQKRACAKKKSNRRSCGEYAVKNVDREDLSTVSRMKNKGCTQIHTIYEGKRRFVIFL